LLLLLLRLLLLPLLLLLPSLELRWAAAWLLPPCITC
jgi:hypothetical protein